MLRPPFFGQIQSYNRQLFRRIILLSKRVAAEFLASSRIKNGRSGLGQSWIGLKVGEIFIKSKGACMGGEEKAALYLTLKTSGQNITVNMLWAIARWQSAMLAIEQLRFFSNFN